MKVVPWDNRMYIVVEPMQEKIGSINIPNIHSERSRIATVVAVGDKCEPFKAGDKVLIQWHSGVHIHLLGYGLMDDLHRIITKEEILATIEN